MKPSRVAPRDADPRRASSTSPPRTPERDATIARRPRHLECDAVPTTTTRETRSNAREWFERDEGSDDADVEAMLEAFPYELGALESMLDWIPDDETEAEAGTTTTTTTNERASGRAESECGSGGKGAGTSSDDGGTSSMSARSAGKRDGNATETEAERLERLQRNRESAKNMRARKREYVRDLERRASALEKQNGALQGMVMHLTNENHALRMNLQAATGVAIPTMMVPAPYPTMTPKLPLPPLDAPVVETPPSPQLDLKKPAPKRRKKTVAASVTALALGALSVVGLAAPRSNSAGTQFSSSSRRLLAITAAPEDHLTKIGVNVTSLREEIMRNDDERTFSLPDRAAAEGIALWGDKTSDGRIVNVLKSTNVNDPWFSAFKAAGMPQHVNLLSRVSCTEVFKFKGSDEPNAKPGAVATTSAWTSEQIEKMERKKYSGAIPMPSGRENITKVPDQTSLEAEDSLVSVLLPPPVEGVMQQLSKLFVVTFNKRTADYTTHSCLMPQPMTRAHHHV